MPHEILAVDIGNTEIKCATIKDGTVGAVSRYSTLDIDQVVEAIVSQTFPVALCSVRTAATDKIKTALQGSKRTLALQVDSKINSPVSGFYDGMGADRIAEISAAWIDTEGSRPVAVIGLGTATTITTASTAGKFKGGFITLGLGAVSATLTGSLPELPAVDPKQAKSLAPGFDVYSSICRGTVAAHVGIIEKWISLFKEELGEDLAVIGTGGWSQVLEPWCPFFDKVDPLLTLRGIWCIYKESISVR